MDAKEHQLIGDLIQRICARTFHERDILALLILLRAHAPEKSPIREVGDFVAHREKDRGMLKTYMHQVVAFAEASINGTSAQIKIESVYSSRDFYESLNAVLTEFNISKVSIDVADDVLVCVMSVLQEVRLHHNNTVIGHLALCRFCKDLWLCGVVVMQPKQAHLIFPALILTNRYTSPVDSLAPFNGLVEAKCVDGSLQLFVGGEKIS